MTVRINKFLADCGVASRRKSEELVLDGRVKVNGKLVDKLATEIFDGDIVTVDGERVTPLKKHVYIMLNKPKGYVCTTSDEKGRKTVMDLIKGHSERIYPVGRLDYYSEGLLILTTDGDLANRITHPRNEITKTYIAKIEGEISESDLDKLRAGVVLDGVKTNKCRIKVVDYSNNETKMEVVISEGKNRQIRRMFETLNREVVFLKRVCIGDLRLRGLNRGESRPLTEAEINYLKMV